MKVTIKDREALSLCEPNLIKNYLIKKGWNQEQDTIFTFNNNTISFPKVIDNDYFRHVSLALMVLERVENRSQLDIWCDITNKTLFFAPGTEQVLENSNVFLHKIENKTTWSKHQ